MEDIGVEVSLKIRSAIKAKLVELGAYVDDELPDYIMVMVANKRTKIQMENDLKLFLGHNTVHFTGWLHTVLQKLQEVTIASNLNKLNSLEPVVVERLPVKKPLIITIDEEEGHKHVKHKKKTKKSSESSTKKKSVLKKSDKPTKIKVAPILEQNLDKASTIEKPLNLGLDVKSLDQTKIKSSSTKSGIVKLVGESKVKEKLIRETSVELHLLKKSVEASRKLPVEILQKSSDSSLSSPAVSSSQKPGKVPPAQSDEEEFEDVINIKDSGMMEFFDEEELKEDTPNVARPKLKTPPSQEIEVDDLEEQRANLLRDLELLEKPARPVVVCDLDLLGKPQRPPVEKYSVSKALERSKGSSSVLSRLGSKVDVQPRLKIIDPNEFNIVGPPSDEPETAKVKLADRLGKKQPVKLEHESSKNEPMESSSNSNQRKTVNILSNEDGTRRNVMDRLGGKSHSPVFDKNDLDSWEKRAIANKQNRNIQEASTDKKNLMVSQETSQANRSVKERLGSRPISQSTSQREIKPSTEVEAKTKLSDRLGKIHHVKEIWSTSRRDMDKADQTVRKEVTDDSRGSERGKISERLGRKTVSYDKEERPKLSDRLGKKVRESSPEEKSAKLCRVEKIQDDVAEGTGHSNKRMLHRSERMDELPSKRPLLSRVIAVKREAPEDEEIDPNIAVASVIRVQPRPKVPAGMQANRNLLFKAMAEAQKSVATAPVRAVPKDMERKEGLFTHKYRDLGSVKINITLSNDFNESPNEISDRRPAAPRLRHPPNINVTLSNSLKDNKQEKDVGRTSLPSDVQQKQKMNLTLSQRLGESVVKPEAISRQSTPEKHVPSEQNDSGSCNSSLDIQECSNHSSNHVDSNRSIHNVSSNNLNKHDDRNSTLDDDDEGLEEIYEEDEEADVSLNASMGDTDAGEDDLKRYEGDEEYVPTRVSYSADDMHFSTEEEPELQQGYGVNRSIRPEGNTQFVVTLDGLSPEMFNNRKRTVEHRDRTERPASPLPVAENERIHNWLLSLDRANEESEHNVSTVVYKKPRLSSNTEPVKPKERCKYWPSCRQGDQCEFVHPSTSCKSFPSCKFGDKCLYLHPNCKFGVSCARRDCPFSHGTIRTPIGSLQVVKPPSRTRPLQPICKFFPLCTNVNCPFLHPKPCRFGRSCGKSDCSFFHEELPSAEKLKWVKTSQI